MPPLPVIDNVWRAAFVFNSHEGVRPVNVMHFLDAIGTRTAQGMFDNINDALPGRLWSVVEDSYVVEAVQLLKLDGASPTVIVPTDQSTPWQGGSGGEIIPNLAYVVK